jgi:hypothetical protein
VVFLLIAEFVAFALLIVMFVLCATDDKPDSLQQMPVLIVAIIVAALAFGFTAEAWLS